MTKDELIAFEEEVARRFEAKEINGPIHLCSPEQADPLIEIFKQIDPQDWIFATYRSHMHALLHGIPREEVMAQIVAGRSMTLSFPAHHFMSSAIVGGCLPIATGVALALKRLRSVRKVWCFVGDMGSTGGAFHEAFQYSRGQTLPIEFIVEDNGLSCDSPTVECWGPHFAWRGGKSYPYQRTWPHVGSGQFVSF